MTAVYCTLFGVLVCLLKVALDTLLGLLKGAATKERLRQLRGHITAVLDYVECFEHEHTHKVFTLFCQLAEEEDAELHILVRKYLSRYIDCLLTAC